MTKHFSILIAIFAVVLVGVAYESSAATIHSGVILTDETWSSTENPHIVQGVLTVDYGVTLNWGPGCEIAFDSNASVFLNGNLTANKVGSFVSTINVYGETAKYIWSNMLSGTTEVDLARVNFRTERGDFPRFLALFNPSSWARVLLYDCTFESGEVRLSGLLSVTVSSCEFTDTKVSVNTPWNAAYFQYSTFSSQVLFPVGPYYPEPDPNYQLEASETPMHIHSCCFKSNYGAIKMNSGGGIINSCDFGSTQGNAIQYECDWHFFALGATRNWWGGVPRIEDPCGLVNTEYPWEQQLCSPPVTPIPTPSPTPTMTPTPSPTPTATSIPTPTPTPIPNFPCDQTYTGYFILNDADGLPSGNIPWTETVDNIQFNIPVNMCGFRTGCSFAFAQSYGLTDIATLPFGQFGIPVKEIPGENMITFDVGLWPGGVISSPGEFLILRVVRPPAGNVEVR